MTVMGAGRRYVDRVGRIAGMAGLVMMAVYCSAGSASAGVREDAFIAGYAASALEHEFGVRDATILVKDGVVTVDTGSLGAAEQHKVRAALERIKGVTSVELVEKIEEERPADPARVGQVRQEQGGVATDAYDQESKWLPHGLLFQPLHADPRWPRFSATYRYLKNGLNVSSGFSGNFGETFALYRNKAVLDGEWEFGIQAGVFSLLDMEKRSIDLINADYRIGFISSYRSGRFSAFIRAMHQSSHLGDEFLLNNIVQRVNLSYEEIDAKLSFEVVDWLRIYGGGGTLVRREPEIGRGSAQWGVEFTSPTAFADGKIRPVAYADFQVHERSNWAVAHSTMVGLQFENARLGDRRLQLLLEHFFGPSPDGQFYTRKVEWYGIGVHFYY